MHKRGGAIKLTMRSREVALMVEMVSGNDRTALLKRDSSWCADQSMKMSADTPSVSQYG